MRKNLLMDTPLPSEGGRLMDKQAVTASGYAARTARHGIKIVLWAIAWSGTLVLADKAELYGWFTADWMTILAVIINAGTGIGVIVSYMQLLKNQDELQRSIQLNALALSVGVGLVGSFTYTLLVTVGFVAAEELTNIILLMVGTYMVGVIIGQVRYRL